MNRQNENAKKQDEPVKQEKEKAPRSSAFNETRQGNEKNTVNPEEEAGLEQERKEAMTERD